MQHREPLGFSHRRYQEIRNFPAALASGRKETLHLLGASEVVSCRFNKFEYLKRPKEIVPLASVSGGVTNFKIGHRCTSHLSTLNQGLKRRPNRRRRQPLQHTGVNDMSQRHASSRSSRFAAASWSRPRFTRSSRVAAVRDDGSTDPHELIERTVRVHLEFAATKPMLYRYAAGLVRFPRFAEFQRARLGVFARTLGGGDMARILALGTGNATYQMVIGAADLDECGRDRACALIAAFIQGGFAGVQNAGALGAPTVAAVT